MINESFVSLRNVCFVALGIWKVVMMGVITESKKSGTSSCGMTLDCQIGKFCCILCSVSLSPWCLWLSDGVGVHVGEGDSDAEPWCMWMGLVVVQLSVSTLFF